MRHIPYKVVVFPLLTAFVLTLYEVGRFLPQYHYDGPINHVKAALVAITVTGCWKILLHIRKSVIMVAKQHRRLPESEPTGIFSRFGAPITEEALRFFVILLVAGFDSLSPGNVIAYALTVAASYAFVDLGVLFGEFNVTDYDTKYQQFGERLAIFGSTLQWQKKSSAVESEASGQSGDSEESEATLTADNIPEPEPVFNLDLFKATGLTHAQLMPILTSDSGIYATTYSVSPKNTLYSHYCPDNESLEIGSVQPFPVAPCADDVQSVHSAETHYGGGGGGNFKCKFPDGTKVEFGAGAGFDYRHGSSGGKESVLTWKNPLRWFRWLFPMLKDPVATNPADVKRLIRKKLSAYTLNSTKGREVYETTSLLSSTSRVSYGAYDLELQVCTATENVHLFYQFGKFANQYFDMWNTPFSTEGALVDPAFRRFGVTLPRLPYCVFMLHLSASCMWHFAASIIFASLYFSQVSHWPVLLIIPVKLFSVNYLRTQSTASYRMAVGADAFVNLAFFGVAIGCLLW